jgi:hypothetical protein
MQRSLGFHIPLQTDTTLTGHIDVLQIPFGQKTRNWLDSGDYNSSIVQAWTCTWPTPACILTAEGRRNGRRWRDLYEIDQAIKEAAEA